MGLVDRIGAGWRADPGDSGPAGPWRTLHRREWRLAPGPGRPDIGAQGARVYEPGGGRALRHRSRGLFLAAAAFGFLPRRAVGEDDALRGRLLSLRSFGPGLC